MAAREARVSAAMARMEKSVIQEENKKAKLLEDNINNYERKKD